MPQNSRFLITPSLYSSWHWYVSASDERQGQARNELITTLRREQIPPNEAMLAGRKFEDDIQTLADGQLSLTLELEHPHYQDCVKDIAEIVKGGLWQERIYHDIRFHGHGDFLLYGKADVIKGPWIYDIKFTKNYDIGKYTWSLQHPSYMTGSGLKRFAYLVSNGRDWWREDYVWTPEAQQQMRANLSDMLDDIKRDRELAALYEKHWVAR